MKILSVKITEFGGLCDFSLDFSDGINIIIGDNESGKSTVALFVGYMLYGIPSAKKNTPTEFDKERSLSWGNLRAEGSITVEDGGRMYRIERSNKGRTASSEARMTDIDSGECVYVGESVGEELLGVSRETFESCLWCGQTRTASISGAKLAETLSNLSLSADESINTVEVLKRLREEKKIYKKEKGHGGLIDDAADELLREKEKERALSAQISEKQRYAEEQRELEEQVLKTEKRFEAADRRRQAVPKIKILHRFEDLKKMDQELKVKKEALCSAEEKFAFGKEKPDAGSLERLKLLREQLKGQKRRAKLLHEETESREEIPYDATARALSERIALEGGADKCVDTVARMLNKLRKAIKIRKLFFFLTAIFSMAAALCLLVFWWIAASVAAVAVLFAAIGITGAASVAKTKKSLDEFLGRFGVSDIEGFNEELYISTEETKLYDEMCRKREETDRQMSETKRAIEHTEHDIRIFFEKYGISSGFTDSDIGNVIEKISLYISEKARLCRAIDISENLISREKESLSRYNEEEIRTEVDEAVLREEDFDEREAELEYNRVLETREREKERLFALRNETGAIGALCERLADQKAKIAAIEEKHKEAQRQYKVLERAFLAVDEAAMNMRRNFAPKIRECAGERLREISEDKYSRIFLSEKLELGIEVSGSERPATSFSTGTADAVYIALRLALIENIFEEEAPFFMDESFAHLDDKRAEKVMELLKEYAKEGNQVILFSCHRREAKICEKTGIDYNLICI